MATDSFEQLVIKSLDDLKTDNQRNFDFIISGQKTLYQKFEDHAKDDITRFEGIDEQFSDAAIAAAEVRGSAKTTAKFWGVCASLPTPIFAALWAIWKWLHHVQTP